MNKNTIDYYTVAAYISSVEGFENYLDEIPGKISSIIQIIQGLFIHDAWLKIYGTNTEKKTRRIQLF